MPTYDANQVARWTGGQWLTRPPATLRGVSIDTRTLAPGNLFVAIRGERFDGHAFLRQAFAGGAAAAVVASGGEGAAAELGPVLRVPDTARALRDMAAAYLRQTGLSVMAVTGSLGKTTVKEMVADVLGTRFVTARTRGNWNNAIGLPLSLLGLEPGASLGVFEVGTNHPGELAPLCAILQPAWGLVTAIAPVHLEHFKSEEGVFLEKSALLKCLPVSGVAVLRSDDPWYGRLRECAPARVLTVALSGAADYEGTPPAEWGGAARVVERASGECFHFHPPLPGRHQLANALFAIAVGRAHGLGWGDIRRSLESYVSQPMRWECRTLGGITVVNDAYNANPASMAAALQTFADMPVPGRKWLVLAGMLELGAEETRAHEDLGRLVARGGWSRLVGVGALGGLIAAAAERAGLDSGCIVRCRDQGEAARHLSRDAAPGDAVLLKGSRGQRLEQVLALWTQTLG